MRNELYDRIRNLQDLEACGDTLLDLKPHEQTSSSLGLLASSELVGWLGPDAASFHGPSGALRQLRKMQAAGYGQFLYLGYGYAIRKDVEVGEWVLLDQAVIDEHISRRLGNDHFFAHPHFGLSACVQEFLGGGLKDGCSWTLEAEEFASLEKLVFMRQKQILCADFAASALFTAARKDHLKMAALIYCGGRLEEGGVTSEPLLPDLIQGMHERLSALSPEVLKGAL